MNWHALIPLICLAANATLLTLVLTKGIYNPARRVFAALLGVSILWNLFIFGMRTSPDAATALFWERLVALPAYFFPLLYYHFALLLAGRKTHGRILLAAYLWGMVLVTLALTTGLVVSGVRRTAWAWSPQPGPLGALIIVFMYLYNLLGVLVLFRAYRRLTIYRERNRLAYVLLGSSLMLLGGLLDLAPVVGIHIYPGSILGDVLFAALITVAILRYELLDLKTVFRRSLFYAVLGGLVGGAYLLVVLAMGKLLGRLLGPEGTVATAVAMGVAAVLLWPLWALIEKRIDRLLFPAHHNALLIVDQLGQRITTILQLDQLAAIVEGETARAFQSERVRLLVYEGDRLWAPVAKGVPDADWERSVRDGEPVIGWLQRERRPLSQEELNILPQFKGLWADEISYWRRVGLDLLIPLFIEDHLTAILALGPKLSGQEYEPQEHQLLSIVASQLAIAIENARLFNEEKKRLRETMALHRASQVIASSLELREIFQRVVEELSETFGYPLVGIYLLEGARLIPGAQIGYDPQKEPEFISIDRGVVGRVVRTGQPAFLYDVTQDPDYIPDYPETTTEICVPIRSGQTILGVLNVESDGRRLLTEDDLQLLITISSQIGVAIENARLYEQTDEKLRDRVAELTALNTITASLTGSLELNEMLQAIVTRVAQMMRARICTIRLMEGDELTIGAAVGYEDESARQHRIRIDERLARIVRGQQPLMIEDLWESGDIPLSRRERAKREEIHSFLGVPMVSKGETIGVLSIYGERPHRFTEQEISLLLTIANQAAIAIENARLYERLREHAENLERLVQERTKELEAIHAELLQSAKLAALGQLAAGVAHELNNPLGAIAGYLELMQEEMELGPQGLAYMKKMEERIQQATKIVRELRSGWMPSEPVWQIVDVNDILEETLNLVERQLSLYQIKVQREAAPDLPQIHADPDRLAQVFINLITNARQAMSKGGTLTVISRQSRKGEWLEIIFADTGEGIAKEHLNKIFDPFFTTRNPGEGMGLGLSVSHKHVRDHGGAIDVWSERGSGTVFRVALPTSGAKRCWEILDCSEKERCKAVREKADYRCWSVLEDAAQCERCEVYKRKALPHLDATLLPQ